MVAASAVDVPLLPASSPAAGSGGTAKLRPLMLAGEMRGRPAAAAIAPSSTANTAACTSGREGSHVAHPALAAVMAAASAPT